MSGAERRRLAVIQGADRGQQARLGQFLTPPPVAHFLASLFELKAGDASLLDPGAGIGSLTAAFVDRWSRERRSELRVTAVEIDSSCSDLLRATLIDAEQAGISTDLVEGDFIRWAVERSSTMLPFVDAPLFDYIVMNPPYKKVQGNSLERRLVASLGVDINNLYSAFLVLAMRLLKEDGQLVAITPRSFANGPYFRAFRQDFFSQMSFRQIHLYDARDSAFADSGVLQENVVFRAVRGRPSNTVSISSSPSADHEATTLREAPYDEVVDLSDLGAFIHLSVDGIGAGIAHRMRAMRSSIKDTGLSVSTGRVVEFRARESLREYPDDSTAPLIFPSHFDGQGRVKWPLANHRKPNAISQSEDTASLLMQNGSYVLVKRFSAKEERRRVSAALSEPDLVPGPLIGFENHLNVFHEDGGPLDAMVARGLAAFLNSTIVDLYFRQWSGHTQVNATDMRRFPYPSRDELRSLGEAIGDATLDQQSLDRLVGDHVPSLAGLNQEEKFDPLMAHQRVLEAQDVLRQLGLPRAQTNERSALTLLALLHLTPDRTWTDIEAVLIGITPMMEFMAEHYGRQYAPNSRETVRRQTVHQFVAAGILLQNPDDPERPTNSGLTAYQVPPELIDTLKRYGSEGWDEALANWLTAVPALRDRWARERHMRLIPVRLPNGDEVNLTPGGQNPLIKEIVEEFCSRFVKDGQVLYIGDSGDKFAVWEREALESIGVAVDEHGKMPDLVVLDGASNWLVLIEAVSSHGPMDPKRREELASLFADSDAGLVYVTAFKDRKALSQYLDAISWETEVWVVETPTHMIHFDGERFLGPYAD
jgi:adenine-specific DNA-methyltransferase